MFADISSRAGHRGARRLHGQLEGRLITPCVMASQRLGIARERRQSTAASDRRAIVRNTCGIERCIRFGRDGLACAPRDENRFGSVARHGDDLARDLFRQLALEGSVDHRNAVDVRVVDDDLEGTVDERGVVEDGRSDVDRVEDRAEARHELAQLGARLCRQRRHPHPATDALVGHEDPGAARDGDDRKAVAFGQLAAAKTAPVIDHVLNVLDLDDSGLAKGCLVQCHRAAQIGGVRGGRFLPLLGVADLPHEYGFPRGHRLLAHLDQSPRILEPLDVAHDDLGLRILDVIVHEIDRGNPDFVAGCDHLPEGQAAFERGKIHDREPEAAALRNHADRPRGVMGIEH